VHLDRWMAAAALALFLPQLVFVPFMQGAINRRAGARVGRQRLESMTGANCLTFRASPGQLIGSVDHTS
jgi:hypothetical protein